MPDVTKQALVPDWVSDPSVMDPWYQRAGGTVMRMMGLQDPTNALPTPNMIEGPIADSKLAKELFHRSIDHAVDNSATRTDRGIGKIIVNHAYGKLADQGLAAPPEELARLRSAVEGMKTDGGIKPAPSGLDLAKHQTAIINKLAQIGYKVTPEESLKIADGLQQAGLIQNKTWDSGGGVKAAPQGTGDYVRYLKMSLPNGDKMKAALNQVPSWADGQTVRQLAGK